MSDKEKSRLGFSWIRNPEQKGEFLFTFDGKTVYNLFRDYPSNLTPEQKQIFDRENPFWVDYFRKT